MRASVVVGWPSESKWRQHLSLSLTHSLTQKRKATIIINTMMMMMMMKRMRRRCRHFDTQFHPLPSPPLPIAKQIKQTPPRGLSLIKLYNTVYYTLTLPIGIVIQDKTRICAHYSTLTQLFFIFSQQLDR